MANVVTITRPEVVALIEEAAQQLTGGNKTEVVAVAMRRLLEQYARVGSLFGTHRGSVRVHKGVDLIAPALEIEPDAETGREGRTVTDGLLLDAHIALWLDSGDKRLRSSTRALVDGRVYSRPPP